MVISPAVQTLERELRGIFGSRLQSLAVYGQRAQADRGAHGSHAAHGHDAPPTHTLAIVESLTPDDLRACAGRVEAWHDAGLATPLLFAAPEFEQSLDAFPADLRRACEVQARSHLLHLREGFLETRGRSDGLAVLIVQSAAAFAGLIMSIARLAGHATDDVAAAARHVERITGTPGGTTAEVIALVGVHEIASADAERLFGPYLEAVMKLVQYVDGWSGR